MEALVISRVVGLARITGHLRWFGMSKVRRLFINIVAHKYTVDMQHNMVRSCAQLHAYTLETHFEDPKFSHALLSFTRRDRWDGWVDVGEREKCTDRV